jgi:glycosyltransferase involved in cell wall biosynthesis
MEAAACGTPVVGADSGALADTISEDIAGYHYDPGNVGDFRAKIRRGLREREELGRTCLAQRDSISVEHTLDRLEEHYDALC